MRVIAPDEVITLRERIKGDGTIEQMKVRFFQGQQKSLLVRPYVRHKGNKIEDLITYPEGTNQFLSGENDYLEFDLVVPVENDDELCIWVSNVDADHLDPYTLHVSVMVDYFGGTSRVV